MATITTDITEKASFLVTAVDPDVAEVALMIRDQGGRFVVVGGGAARDLVLRLNTGNGGVAVHLPGDWQDPATRDSAVAECRQCWGLAKTLLLLMPA